MPKVPAYPKSIGNCIDKLYTMREARMLAQKKVDDAKSQEDALREHILACFDKSLLEAGRGKMASCGIVRTVVAQVDDWAQVYEYITENDAFDLLQKRFNNAAYRERLDNSVKVPGVTAFTKVELSLTKSKK